MPKILSLLFFTSLNLYAQSVYLPPPTPKSGNPKLQSALWDIASAAKGAMKPVALPLGVRATEDGKLILFLVPEPGQPASSIDTAGLQRIGGEVLASSSRYLRVAIPPSSLERAAEMRGVQFVRTPIRPQIQSAVSEGADKVNALKNHNRGIKGKGVKVAVIDIGFSGGNERPGDLPSSPILKDFTRSTTSRTTFFSGTVHGTACAELVYDVAPEATLYLIKIDDILDLEQAKDYCVAEKVDIISHSLGWLDTGFGDGKGLACEIIDDAAENGILWVNAAGNFEGRMYQARFASSNDDVYHDFGPSTSKDLMELKKVAKGDTIEIFLTWNEWPVTSEDYDLILFRQITGDEPRLVASSQDVQIVSAPVEYIEHVAVDAERYFIAVYKSPDARTEEFKLLLNNRKHELAFPTLGGGSIGTPADARGAISVGAVDYRNWLRGPIEAYSSQGPTYDGRTKPDIVAPTGVTTGSYGTNGFYVYLLGLDLTVGLIRQPPAAAEVSARYRAFSPGSSALRR